MFDIIDTQMITEMVCLFSVMAMNLVILKVAKISILQITFGLISAIIAVFLVNVPVFPFLNILLILVSIGQVLSGVWGVK